MLCHHHICLVHLPKRKPVPTGQLLPICSHPPPRGKLLGNKRWGVTSSGVYLHSVPFPGCLALLHAPFPSLPVPWVCLHLPQKAEGISVGVLPQALLFRAGLLKLFCQRNSLGRAIMEEEKGGMLPQVQEHWGLPEITRSWKRQRRIFYLRAFEESMALPAPWFGLLGWELWENAFLLF